ncbi:hypothetical protein SAMN05421847_2167 [Halpernia humi]|uniref:Uncharacterized protein n=1 Tax=Halpernia humi TaxID=493375 RepID=A0A1H5ZTA0_9FLAO|nr:hypothetical protein [Halpernia humi]SEG39015.1 hypothetical protein SAMN05421847_2167 [Halpernia humi]
MIINGHEYTKEEIFEALKMKGFTLLPFIYQDQEAAFMGGVDFFEVTTKCAVKGYDLPALKNTWDKVALKEFEKTNTTKPPLI